MNTQLVESLAQIINTLTIEERLLLGKKIDVGQSTKEPPLFERLTPAERAKIFEQWADSHRHQTPLLSDEAISRESIYGERI
jgi:hypothetical protein